MDCHTEDTKNEGRQILSLRVAVHVMCKKHKNNFSPSLIKKMI